MKAAQPVPLRPVIRWSLVVCVVTAIAPWLSGGQTPLALLLSAAAVATGSLLLWRQPGVRRLVSGPLVWAYAGLVGWGALSLIWTANRYSTLLWLMMMALAGIVFCLSYVLAGEEAGRRQLMGAYLVSVGLFAGYGFWLYFTDGYDRLTSSFYWANPAAAYLIPAILLALHGLRRPGRWRWAWVAVTAWFGTAFMLTDSRAATLVLGFLVGVYLLVQPGLKRYWITVVFVLASVILLSNGAVYLRHWLQPNAAAGVPGARFAEAASGESRSGSDRLQYLISAGEMWWARPITGVGAGAYGDVHPQYQHGVVSAATNAHNFYVQLLAELGLVGAVFLAWLLFVLLIGTLRGLLALPLWSWSVPWVLGLAGLMLHSGLDIDTRYPALVALLAAMFGLLYAQARREVARLSWRLPAAALLLLVLAASLYVSDSWVQRARISQDNGDYQQAADQFDRAGAGLVANPDWMSAAGINLYTLATAAPEGSATRGNLAGQALDRARQAASLDPADAQHQQLEGRIWQLQGDVPAAQAAFTRALALDSLNHPEYAEDLALVQLQQGHDDEALVTAHAMLDRYPDDVLANRSSDVTVRPAVANVWALVGNIELQRGQLAEARRAVGRALTIDPQNLRGRALKHQLALRPPQ